jgi:hypothetical protein
MGCTRHATPLLSFFTTKLRLDSNNIQNNIIQLLHFIECDMMCYGALKSNIDQG